MQTVGMRIAILLLLGMFSTPAVYAQAPPALSASQLQELNTSFNALFAAMKDGNVAVIETYFSGAMLTEYRKLLEQNQDYPDFLRNFYKGASFRIAGVTPAENGEAVVAVAIQLGSGSTSITRLAAQRFAGSPATWKVIAVVSQPDEPPARNN